MTRWEGLILGLCIAWFAAVAKVGSGIQITGSLAAGDIAQLGVTVLSALIALGAALIASASNKLTRQTRLELELEKIAAAVVEAFTLDAALERAGKAFEEAAPVQRERLRQSALTALMRLKSHIPWPADLEIALIEARFILEDLAVDGTDANRAQCQARVDVWRTECLDAVRKMNRSADKLNTEIGKLSRN